MLKILAITFQNVFEFELKLTFQTNIQMIFLVRKL